MRPAEASVMATAFAALWASLLHPSGAQECGGFVVNAPTTISSPNYPNYYYENTQCRWVVLAPPGRSVNIFFMSFDLGDGPDTLNIFDGAPVTCDSPFTTFTNNDDAEGTTLELGRNVTVVFSSGKSSSGAGFQLIVEFELSTVGSRNATSAVAATPLSPTPNCGGSLWGSGELKSPSYPESYSANTRCVWQLWPKSGRSITLHIVNLRLESPWDTLRVYRSASPLPIAEYTGTLADVTKWFERGSVITLVFTSDQSVQLSGFQVTFHSDISSSVPSFFPPSNLPSPGTCGVPVAMGVGKNPDEEDLRIVGGVASKPLAWPWQAFLMYYGEFKCGGSLITSQWVVTAAHCINLLSPWLYTLLLGKYRQYATDATEQRFAASKIIVHPSYNSNSFDSDIALIKLNRSATFNSAVRPVCLSAEEMDAKSSYIVTGWGDTKFTGSNAVLREVRVPILSRACCSNVLQDRFTKNMTCAGYLDGGKDACQGDSGGPLVGKRGRAFYLYGITSWGNGCAEPLSPGVYTRVPGYVRWINRMIAAN